MVTEWNKEKPSHQSSLSFWLIHLMIHRLNRCTKNNVSCNVTPAVLLPKWLKGEVVGHTHTLLHHSFHWNVRLSPGVSSLLSLEVFHRIKLSCLLKINVCTLYLQRDQLFCNNHHQVQERSQRAWHTTSGQCLSHIILVQLSSHCQFIINISQVHEQT